MIFTCPPNIYFFYVLTAARYQTIVFLFELHLHRLFLNNLSSLPYHSVLDDGVQLHSFEPVLGDTKRDDG
jgi:hypothetical protein